MKLRDHAWNRYSQYGEDGIIDQICKDLYLPSYGTCGEFGAADGFFCSNTAALWEAGWEALLIEPNGDLMPALHDNTASYPNVTVKCLYVNDVDECYPEPLTILSMDVDGNEPYLLEKMEVRHRVLVVEHNPTVPPDYEMIGPRDTLTGASALSLTKIAESKGYRLIAATDTNLFFVVEEDFDCFEDYDTDLDSIFVRTHLNYVITNYVGGYQEIGPFPYGKVQEEVLIP